METTTLPKMKTSMYIVYSICVISLASSLPIARGLHDILLYLDCSYDSALLLAGVVWVFLTPLFMVSAVAVCELILIGIATYRAIRKLTDE